VEEYTGTLRNATLAWGARGPEFKSRRSDQLNQVLTIPA
jgi:hypothetical protein